MKLYALKITKGEDLLLAIERFTQENKLHAGVVLSAVGTLYEAQLLHGNGVSLHPISDTLEIISLTGTTSKVRGHIHASFAKSDLSVIGGHLAHGCFVADSAEVIIADFDTKEIKSTKPGSGTKSSGKDKGINDELITSLFNNK